MCLAIPMRVVDVSGDPDNFFKEQAAVVEADGLKQRVRLDVVDSWPEVGDFVIVHAGFAIHSLTADEAEKNLALLREMAQGLAEREGRG